MKHLAQLKLSASMCAFAFGCLAFTPYAVAQDDMASPAADDGTAEVAQAEEADAAPSNEAIVVTGSRISRRDLVAQSPIVTTSQENLQAAGLPTVDAALIQLPQFQPGSGGFTNQSQGGLGIGQAQLNLRGLQAVRTLVLLDGRRLQPGNAQNVIDTNIIPSSAIEGTEVITGGASATYGSDAIAGVVNFKLRRSYEGLRLSGQVGISDKGDAANHQFSLLAGTKFADGRGSVMLAAEYADRATVGYRDRDFSNPTAGLSALTLAGYYAPSSNNLPSQAVVNGVFGTYGVASGAMPRTGNFGVNADGTLFRSGAPDLNYRSGAFDACVVDTPTTFGYDGFCTNNLQGGLKRYSALARAEYEVSSNVTLFAQGIYAHSEATGQGSHPALQPTGASGLSVKVTNPFIPADLRAVLASRPDPTANFVYAKRFGDNGPRRYQSETDTFQILGGLRGQIPGIDWDFEAYASYGRAKSLDTTVGSNSLSATQRLIDAADGGASLCAGGLGIFGPGPVSAQCAAYIRRDTETRTRVAQTEFSASTSGTLFTLPAGEVKGAISANYRENSFDAMPDAGLQAGDIASVVAVQPTRGKIKVAEIAGELLIPLLSDLPLIQSLNFTPGYRYSKYSPGGGVSTYKLNFDWRVADPLLIRGGYQKAVRAPNIGELYQAPTGILVNIGGPPSSGDPCDVRTIYRTGTNAASVRALCLAQGVPANVVDSFNQANGGIQATSAGNPDLEPERATTFTIGAVVQPRFLGGAFDRLNLSVDYYNIKIKGVIGTLDVPTSLAKCFNSDGSNSAYSASNYFCTNLTRDPATGQIVQSLQTLLNLGGYRTAGIDAQLDWALDAGDIGLPSGFGRTDLSLAVNYLDKFDIQVLPGAPYQDYVGAISPSSGTTGIQSFAKWKMSGSVTQTLGDFQIGLRWRHYSKFRDVNTVTNSASTVAGTKAYDYFDIVGKVDVGERFELRGGITNIADRQPPTVGTFAGITNLGIYDAIGRSFYVGFTASF